MNEDENFIRQEAVRLYLQGMKPSRVCKELHRSRPWFYKWLRRYETAHNDLWFEELSRRPHTIQTKTVPEMEQLVVNIRRRLEKTSYAQIGAITIQWEIKRLGQEPPPVWTINRILKKHQINRPQPANHKERVSYPGQGYSLVHQMDFVGPRYIKNDGRFYALNLISIDTHCVHINPLRSKATDGVVQSIVRFWQCFGLPDFLQMDNELSFRGSNRHPHSFGTLIRLALSQGVCPIFIPLGEPWRNGVIERFNDTFDKKFFLPQVFESFDHLKQESKIFEEFHNQYYRYSAHQNRTPMTMFHIEKPTHFLSDDYQIPDKIPLDAGNIILFRFIRSDQKFSIFGEVFYLDKQFVYSYVKAVISIEAQALKVYQDNKLIKEFEYRTPVDWGGNDVML